VEGPLKQVSTDKAYDSFGGHKSVLAKGVNPVIPPRKGAAFTLPLGAKNSASTRGAIVRRITKPAQRHGRLRPNSTDEDLLKPQCSAPKS